MQTNLSILIYCLLCRFIRTLFDKKQRQISRYIKQAWNALCSDFVLSFLGFHNISREVIVQEHTTYYATQIFDYFLSDSVISIMDGTYLYIQQKQKQKPCISVSMFKHAQTQALRKANDCRSN